MGNDFVNPSFNFGGAGTSEDLKKAIEEHTEALKENTEATKENNEIMRVLMENGFKNEENKIEMPIPEVDDSAFDKTEEFNPIDLKSPEFMKEVEDKEDIIPLDQLLVQNGIPSNNENVNNNDISNVTSTPAPVVPEIPVMETPVAPVEPVSMPEPVIPAAPVVPEVPVMETPVAPAEPVSMSEPVIPTAPVVPEVPVMETPVAPVEPVSMPEPVMPTEPQTSNIEVLDIPISEAISGGKQRSFVVDEQYNSNVGNIKENADKTLTLSSNNN